MKIMELQVFLGFEPDNSLFKHHSDFFRREKESELKFRNNRRTIVIFGEKKVIRYRKIWDFERYCKAVNPPESVIRAISNYLKPSS